MLKRRSLALPLVLLLIGGCGGSSETGAGTEAGNLVGDYCAYGAVSKAQLEGCVEHVTPATVNGYDTNAARYAEGQLDACLADSGPFCKPR